MIRQKAIRYFDLLMKYTVRVFPWLLAAFILIMLYFAFRGADVTVNPVFSYSSVSIREEFGSAGVNLVGGPVVVHPHVKDFERMFASELEGATGMGSSISFAVKIINEGYNDIEINFSMNEGIAPDALKSAVRDWRDYLEEYYVCPIEDFRFKVTFDTEARRTVINVTKIEGVRESRGSVFYAPTGKVKHAYNILPVRYDGRWRLSNINFQEGTKEIYRDLNEKFRKFTGDNNIEL